MDDRPCNNTAQRDLTMEIEVSVEPIGSGSVTIGDFKVFDHWEGTSGHSVGKKYIATATPSEGYVFSGFRVRIHEHYVDDQYGEDEHRYEDRTYGADRNPLHGSDDWKFDVLPEGTVSYHYSWHPGQWYIEYSVVSVVAVFNRLHTGHILRSASTGAILRDALTGVILRDA